MTFLRMLLACLALFPISAFMAASPAMAQAGCQWNLDGEWVGQSSGNRVMIEMRPGGFVSWISGQPKPGQSDANNLFRDAGPKVWSVTFPGGEQTTARLEAGNMLRISNPDGWTDLFKPVTQPRCLSSGVAAGPSANKPARKPQAVPVVPFDPNRLVTKIDQGDLAALVRENGDSIVSEMEQGEVSINAVTTGGLHYILVGTACNLPDYGTGCLGIEYQVRYDADANVSIDNINVANQNFRAAKTYRGPNDVGVDTVFVSHYAILDGGQKMGNLKAILENVLAIAPQVSNIIWP